MTMINTPTDYTRDENWMYRPENPELPADVFYLYPTAYYKTPQGPMVCDASHQGMRLRAREHVDYKGSAFLTAGNYFVPYYRQAALECLLNLDITENEAAFAQGPVTDCLGAFHHYITHLNQGRPFILAGHSQGSLMMQCILSEYFKKHPEVQQRMIAAYCIGFAVTRDFMKKNPHLKFAQGRQDLGSIISYNTEAPGYTGPNITLAPEALVINPISWRRDETLAPAAQSLGSRIVLRDARGCVTAVEDRPHFADAQLDLKRGVVVCSTVPAADFRVIGQEAAFPQGVMHTADYPLYYYDLRKNAEERAAAWFSGGACGI
ncbi:MAG: DUF3089 domain-containing protein [Eubacterium sp.]|nr:DUF3089 domain-containing protein [Eubacterium sp.]